MNIALHTYFLARAKKNKDIARRASFRRRMYKASPKPFYGYTFYQNRFLFTCPCGDMLCLDHSKCNAYFSEERRQLYMAQFSTIIYGSV